MTKQELIDLLYKAIDFINGNDKPEIAQNSYYRVDPFKRERGFSKRYYIHVGKQANGGCWYCSIIDIDRRDCGFSKDCLYEEEWLQSLFEASKVTEINQAAFTIKWNKAKDMLSQMAEL